MVKGNSFFSWSPYREDLFNECELCYALHYYTADKGWLNDSSTESRAAYRWKQATSIEQAIESSFLERLIDDVYSEDKFSAKDLRSKVLDDLNAKFKESVTNKHKWYNSPKHVTMLYELVYEDTLDKNIIINATKKVNRLIEGFLDSVFIKELSDSKSELVDIRGNFKNPFTYFNLEEIGVRAYIGIQTIHKKTNGSVVATLFKTTNKESTISQIGAVAKLISDNTDINLSDITVREEFLLTGKYTDHPITEDIIDLMYSSIDDSIGMMSEFVVDGDIKNNEFLGLKNIDYTRSLKHYKEQEEMTPMTHCSYCEAVRRDLQLYPNGYDRKIEQLSKI